MSEGEEKPGLKEDELRKLATCAACGKLVGQINIPIFWKMRSDRHMLDITAISRQQGLTDLLGGSAILAQAMGTDREMTRHLGSATFMVCDPCMIKRLPEVFGEIVGRDAQT